MRVELRRREAWSNLRHVRDVGYSVVVITRQKLPGLSGRLHMKRRSPTLTVTPATEYGRLGRWDVYGSTERLSDRDRGVCGETALEADPPII